VDDWEYLNLGKEIAEGDWTPLSESGAYMLVGPWLPMVVALCVMLFGDPILPMFIYNVLLTTVFIPVLYYIGKALFNKKVGILSAIWGIFYIECLKYLPHILKEPTLFLFLPLSILFLINFIKSDNNIKYLAFAAVSFTILIHTDERFFVYFPVFIGFFVINKSIRFKRLLKHSSIWILFVILLMLPWGVRNYKVFEELVILTPRTTAITSNIWSTKLLTGASHFSNEDVKEKLLNNHYERAVEFGEKYDLKPRKFGKNEARFRAFVNFWQPVYFQPTYYQYGYRPIKWSLRHNIASILFYGIFLPFYIVGMVLLFRKRLYLPLFIAVIPILHSLMHAYMVWPLERYRSPVTFIVVIIGIWAVIELYSLIKHRYSKQSN
jgi:hypothetical protein